MLAGAAIVKTITHNSSTKTDKKKTISILNRDGLNKALSLIGSLESYVDSDSVNGIKDTEISKGIVDSST